MRALAAALVALVALAGRAAAAPPDWRSTFTVEASATYLHGQRPGLLVAAGPTSRAAADALAEALRKSGRTRIVMDAAALGDIGALDDKAIVQRAAPFPVDHVVVVRVFPGDNFDTAVVTMYDREGGVIAGFTAEQGVPLASHGGADAGQGVSEETANAVSHVLHPNGVPAAAHKLSPEEEQFLDSHLGFERNAFVANSWGAPVVGRYGRHVDVEEFYRIAEHAELADLHAKRRRSRAGLVAAGVIGLLAGGTMTLVGGLWGYSSPFCNEQNAAGTCLDASHPPNGAVLGVGIGLVAVGVGALVWRGFIDPTVSSERDCWQMAREHNVKLRRSLRLPDAHDDDVPDEVQRPPAAAPPAVSLAPSLGPQGASLSLRLDF